MEASTNDISPMVFRANKWRLLLSAYRHMSIGYITVGLVLACGVVVGIFSAAQAVFVFVGEYLMLVVLLGLIFPWARYTTYRLTEHSLLARRFIGTASEIRWSDVVIAVIRLEGISYEYSRRQIRAFPSASLMDYLQRLKRVGFKPDSFISNGKRILPLSVSDKMFGKVEGKSLQQVVLDKLKAMATQEYPE